MALTTFHIIHIIAGFWLIAAPYLGLLTTRSALNLNNLIVGAVIVLYNAWFLFVRNKTDLSNRG